MRWFDVDKEGLRAVLARKGVAFVLYEIISNSWDAPGVTEVNVTLRRVKGTLARIEVEDDSPLGFTRISDAYTLFSRSERGAVAETRGRFSLGEKTAVAVMDRARIVSTKGAVIFDGRGRRESDERRDRGSLFAGELHLTDAEIEECREAVRRLLPPRGIVTRFNGENLLVVEPVVTVEETLPTELADEEGRLRPTRRKTQVEIYRANGQAYLYELGVPVVEIDGVFSVSVCQKTPVSFQRDGVPPSYLAKIRAIVLATMTPELTVEDANAAWARDAIAAHGDTLPESTVKRVLDLRFGEKRVSYDPTDPEANKRAVAAGYTVVYGSQMSSAEWEAARRVSGIKPAGQVTPSPRPDGDPDGQAREYVDEAKWTPAIREVVALVRRLSIPLIGREVTVLIANDVTWPFAATFGGNRFTFNVGRLGYAFFEGDLASIIDLVTHEFGHAFSSDHLSASYYDALTALSGKLVVLALERPELFVMRRDAGRTAPLRRIAA